MVATGDQRVAALNRLPPVYARAVRLRDGGADVADIASELEIEVVAVKPLLAIADAKLQSLLVQACDE